MDVLSRLQDPRYYQIAVLTSLVAFGVVVLDFGIRWQNATSIVATALAVQYVGTRFARLQRFDPLSPLITSLSLTLLLRTDEPAIAALAAVIAIGSKFLIRFRNKHVFNPANVALVSLMLASDHAWISSGQWGSAAIGAFSLACLGFLVLTRARRAETTIAFLIIYAALLGGRALWLGDPLAIPLHQLQNGALLIFAFFMISDPKTTPDTAWGRVIFAALVATVAFSIQFIYYQPNGPILALIAMAPTVPLIDFLMRGELYSWDRAVTRNTQFDKGVYR
ncbi:MAG: RnfABCDGE type electron transport complex subunit D [Gammaproteobacteria bacterium]|nr:RnfABCDGE type electron transport complex subunit D [Gammaproteobacteria bacterium]